MSAPQSSGFLNRQENLKNLKETLLRQIEDAKTVALQRIDELHFEFNGENFVEYAESSPTGMLYRLNNDSPPSESLDKNFPNKKHSLSSCESSFTGGGTVQSVIDGTMSLGHIQSSNTSLSCQLLSSATAADQEVTHSALVGSPNPDAATDSMHTQNSFVRQLDAQPKALQPPRGTTQNEVLRGVSTLTPASVPDSAEKVTLPYLVSHADMIDELLKNPVDKTLGVSSKNSTDSTVFIEAQSSSMEDLHIDLTSNNQMSDLANHEDESLLTQNNAVINSPQSSLVEGDQSSELQTRSSLTDENSTGNSPTQQMPFGYHKFLMLYIKCYISTCKELFTSRDDLKNHLKNVHNTKFYKCYQNGCSFEAFERFKNLKRHFEVHHSKLDKWVCVKCYENSQEPTYFSNADKLDEHVRHNHENVGLFVCVVEGCEEIFACSGHAFSHFYNKHNSRSKGKKCVLREGVVIRKEAIKTSNSTLPAEMFREDLPITESEHYKVTAMFKTNLVMCPVKDCNNGLKSEAALNQHLLDKHQLKDFRCSAFSCTKSFDTKEDLIVHSEYHHPSVSWDCSRCHKRMSSVYEHNKHEFLCLHQGVFSCNFNEECNLVFKHRFEVIQHYVQNHVG